MRLVLCVTFLVGFVSAAPLNDIPISKVVEPNVVVGSSSIDFKDGQPIVTLEQRSDAVVAPVESIIKKSEEVINQHVPVVSEVHHVVEKTKEQQQPSYVESHIVPVVPSNVASEPILVDKISETSAEISKISSPQQASIVPSSKPEEVSVSTKEIVSKVEEVHSVPVQRVVVPEVVKPVEQPNVVRVEEPSVPVSQPKVVSVQKSPVESTKPVQEVSIVSEKVPQPIEHKVDTSNGALKPSIIQENQVESRSFKESVAGQTPVEVPVDTHPVVLGKVENVVVDSVPVVAIEQPKTPVESVSSIVVSESQSGVITPIVEPVSIESKPISEKHTVQESPIVPEPKPIVIQEPVNVPVVSRVSHEQHPESIVVDKPVEIYESVVPSIVPEPIVVASSAQQVPSVDIDTSKPQQPSVENQVPVEPIKSD